MSRLAIVLFLFCCGGLSARIHLLVDERLRKTPLEQVIYKFVPLTNAAEVELVYVRDFMRGGAAEAYAAKMKEQDRAIYLGADRWPGDNHVGTLVRSKAWLSLLGKIYFLVINDAPSYAQLPKGLFAQSDLWRKYSELSGARYAGFHNLHFLDNRPLALKDWRAGRTSCVHESGKELSAGSRAPWVFTKEGVRLAFRQPAQAAFTGDTVCINTPYADTIFEMRIARTDVLLETQRTRFSAWNDAQPLQVKITADRHISAPLALEIVPEVNQSTTEFFFQGDRIECQKNACRKKNARFLLPQMRDFTLSPDLAVRAEGSAYFRGTLRLMSGEIEVARTALRLLPHSWLAELGYALAHPSEYRAFFLAGIAGLLLLAAILFLLLRLISRLLGRYREKKEKRPVAQSSVVIAVQPGDRLHITATANPFGCELLDFGGIVDIEIGPEAVKIAHGSGQGGSWHMADFRYRLPDGYVIDFRRTPAQLWLYLYQVSGTDSSQTSARPGQSREPQRQTA